MHEAFYDYVWCISRPVTKRETGQKRRGVGSPQVKTPVSRSRA